MSKKQSNPPPHFPKPPPPAAPSGNAVMAETADQQRVIDHLEDFVAKLKSGSEDDLQWFALSVKTGNGTVLAFHSKGAPKRPKGVSL